MTGRCYVPACRTSLPEAFGFDTLPAAKRLFDVVIALVRTHVRPPSGEPQKLRGRTSVRSKCRYTGHCVAVTTGLPVGANLGTVVFIVKILCHARLAETLRVTLTRSDPTQQRFPPYLNGYTDGARMRFAYWLLRRQSLSLPAEDHLAGVCGRPTESLQEHRILASTTVSEGSFRQVLEVAEPTPAEDGSDASRSAGSHAQSSKAQSCQQTGEHGIPCGLSADADWTVFLGRGIHHHLDGPQERRLQQCFFGEQVCCIPVCRKHELSQVVRSQAEEVHPVNDLLDFEPGRQESRFLVGPQIKGPDSHIKSRQRRGDFSIRFDLGALGRGLLGFQKQELGSEEACAVRSMQLNTGNLMGTREVGRQVYPGAKVAVQKWQFFSLRLSRRISKFLQ